jgi:PAS domain S-box-containing protein
MNKLLRVLVVEDADDDTQSLVHELRHSGYEPVIKRATSPQAVKAALEEETWDVIFCNCLTSSIDYLAISLQLEEKKLNVPFVILSGERDKRVATAREFVQRKQTVEALRLSRQQVVEILESIADAFYSLDHEFRFTYVNRKAEQLWGMDRTQLLGQVIWDVFPHSVGSKPYHEHYNALNEQTARTFETISPILNFWVEVSIYPSPNGLSIYFRDIRERKRAENEVKQYANRLQVLNESFRVFAEVTTDYQRLLETPLSSVSGKFLAIPA